MGKVDLDGHETKNNCLHCFTCGDCGLTFSHPDDGGPINEYPSNAERKMKDEERMSLCDDCFENFKDGWLKKFGKHYPYGSDLLGESFK